MACSGAHEQSLAIVLINNSGEQQAVRMKLDGDDWYDPMKNEFIHAHAGVIEERIEAKEGRILLSIH